MNVIEADASASSSANSQDEAEHEQDPAEARPPHVPRVDEEQKVDPDAEDVPDAFKTLNRAELQRALKEMN